MNDRMGFVSTTGAVLAVIALAVVLVWTWAAGPVLFSSGPLNAVAGQPRGGVTNHAALSHKCAACHTAPWSSQTMVDRCLACHTEVAAEIEGKSGLHWKLMGGLRTPTCRGCHVEHHGSASALTVTDGTGFPHDVTGYSLRSHRRTTEGKPFSCADCHGKDLSTFNEATCTDCHATIDAAFMRRHIASFGNQCLLCHNGSASDASGFDHSKAQFKLVGKHAGLACDKCHTQARSQQRIQDTPQDCYSCHAKDDKHAGRFGKDCGQCHTPNTWANAKFDHKIFPVDHGREERTPTCETCHPKEVSTYTCYGCHEHTPARVLREHEGRPLAQLTDCIRCHQGGRSEGGD